MPRKLIVDCSGYAVYLMPFKKLADMSSRNVYVFAYEQKAAVWLRVVYPGCVPTYVLRHTVLKVKMPRRRSPPKAIAFQSRVRKQNNCPSFDDKSTHRLCRSTWSV